MQAHDFAAIITRLELITEFPRNLDAFREASKLDPRIFESLNGEVLTYTAPSKLDPPSTIILKVSLPGKVIVVNKCFDRSLLPER